MNQEININQILYTKNGKLIGNAIINKIDLKHNQITIVTDLGETSIMPFQMIKQLFDFGEVSNSHKNAFKCKQRNIDVILKDVSEYRKMSLETIKSKCRKRELLITRVLLTKIARDFTSISTPKLGLILNRTHDNVLYYMKISENEKQFELQNIIKDFKEKYKYSN